MPGEVVVQIAVEAVMQVAAEVCDEATRTAISQSEQVSRPFRCFRVVVLLGLAMLPAWGLALLMAEPFSLGVLALALLAAVFLGIFGFGAYRDVRVLLFG